jgi:hypothetical protein
MFYEVILFRLSWITSKIPSYLQYVYFSKNFRYFDNFDYIFNFFFYSFDQVIFEDIRETKSFSCVFAEETNSKTLDQLLFKVTTLGYFYFGRVTVFDSAFASSYSPFLSVQQFKHSTLLEVI